MAAAGARLRPPLTPRAGGVVGRAAGVPLEDCACHRLEMEAMLLAGDTGHLHVVDNEKRLIGLVSRTDLLRHYALYQGLDDLAPGRVHR